jgi:hypothetical protein
MANRAAVLEDLPGVRNPFQVAGERVGSDEIIELTPAEADRRVAVELPEHDRALVIEAALDQGPVQTVLSTEHSVGPDCVHSEPVDGT